MQYKKPEYFAGIERFIDEYKELNGGASPSLKVIARNVGLSEATVCKYLKVMREKGIVECEGHRHITTRRSRGDAGGSFLAPVVGTVACGGPILAEENIEEYVKLPVALFGSGNFFILRARGDSMIDAGIADGDLVVVRQQDTADYNQIVVALLEDEATLKRFRPEADRVVLHAENPNFDDIIVDSCAIQGVAVKVIKDLQ